MTSTQLRYVLPVIGRLGIKNVSIVALYRMLMKSGLLPSLMPVGQPYGKRFFRYPDLHCSESGFQEYEGAALLTADRLCEGYFKFFSFHEFKTGNPPRWFENPFKHVTFVDVSRHWSLIDDFKSGFGDIKTLWELSRFTWAPDLARAYLLSGKPKYLDELNFRISSWTQMNPLNVGPNWKCGQESGIRLLHTLLTACLLKQHENPEPDLVRFVVEHCRRIEPTIYYALAQNNNHGTSEAAALYVGGLWLTKVCSEADEIADAIRWKDKGRRMLLERVYSLVENDGSFSQYSTVYHRVLVDTLSMAEFWRKILGDQEFTSSFITKCKAAVDWLASMIDTRSGNVPNIGANDGASLYRLHDCDYRDFRPSVQLGSALFAQGVRYDPGPWNEPLHWLGPLPLDRTSCPLDQQSRVLSKGGYVMFKPTQGQHFDSWGVLRYPQYRFRPSHADALHLDLWHRGINLLRDSGTYSYNAEGPLSDYFGATRAHNTIELDGRDQMPRLSRFLRGAWLRMQTVGKLQSHNETVSWAGGYRDYANGVHRRIVECSGSNWKITDSIAGAKDKAILRWRLAPSRWQLDKNHCYGELADMKIESNVPILRSELVEGWESLYYLQYSVLPVWEIDIGPGPATLTTYIKLK